MARHIDLDRYRKERLQKTEEITLTFADEDYTITPKLSFLMTRFIIQFEEELKVKTEGDPGLTNTTTQIWVMDRAGELIRQFVGEDNWEKMLKNGFDANDALTFVEILGNEAALQREQDVTEQDDPKASSPANSESQTQMSSTTGNSLKHRSAGSIRLGLATSSG